MGFKINYLIYFLNVMFTTAHAEPSTNMCSSLFLATSLLFYYSNYLQAK